MATEMEHFTEATKRVLRQDGRKAVRHLVAARRFYDYGKYKAGGKGGEFCENCWKSWEEMVAAIGQRESLADSRDAKPEGNA